ncbi:XapX domain-containing protein [Sulfitobacter sp. S190]|uniref:XapX domain-containing protein n=1 Tax=Sulfitobacter sp. S190 TaxID=2867022 RepID=UPI0021A540D0|nr:XapX domain-containing protein [Sulfitobacter sp. S190]UWR24527.1 XapX domain-containing protein [Sulfitobacter sp. S190]
MSWTPFIISTAIGVLVGLFYGLLTVRSPAPPAIALLGLLGMLAGESAVTWLRGHTDLLGTVLHSKSFHVAKTHDQDKPTL